MSKKKKKEDPDGPSAPEETAKATGGAGPEEPRAANDPGAGGTAAGAGSGAQPAGPTPAELEEQLKTLTDRLQRTTAEFANYQKRVQKEMDDMRKYAVKPLALDLLGVIDSLDRALDAAGANTAGSAGAAPDDFLSGFRMIRDQLFAVLAAHGIVPIDALHKPFDPNCHDAMMEEQNPSFPDRTVIDELVKGFMLHDRLLRPSRVRVSRRPEQSESEEGSD